MNLATGCSSCGTMFRVVQDQLKVSDGWVRCGHCHAVFNALESLVDLDLDTLPVAAPPPALQADTEQALPSEVDAPQQLRPTEAPRPAAWPAVDSRPAGLDETSRAAASAVFETDASPAVDRDHVDIGPPPFATAFPPSRAPDIDLDLVLPPDPPRAAGEARTGAASTFGTASEAPESTHATSVLDAPLPAAFVGERPGFARASGAARRRPAGWLGALAAVLLLALLAGQWAHQQRGTLAVRFPAVRPALASWCDAIGCRLELPRSIDDLAVESTGLTQTSRPGAFKLAVGLRNRGTTPLALPAVELSLSDTGGQLIARKVLLPKDFEQAPASLLPGGDTTLQALLATPGGLVSGYTVEIFYP